MRKINFYIDSIFRIYYNTFGGFIVSGRKNNENSKNDTAVKREIFESMLKHYETLLEKYDTVLPPFNKKTLEKYISVCRIELIKCQYEECEHLWVTLPSAYEDEDSLYGCVKCGFTNGFVPDLDYISADLDENEIASFEYMTMQMYDYPSKHIGCWCNLELGKAIYRKIIDAYPDATDEQISDYFSYALFKTRTKDQSEKRKASRIKRLGLNRNFNAWNPEFAE